MAQAARSGKRYKKGSGFSGGNAGGLKFKSGSYEILKTGGEVVKTRGLVVQVNGEKYGVAPDTGMITHAKSGMGIMQTNAEKVSEEMARDVKEAAAAIERVKRENPRAYSEAVARKTSAEKKERR